MIGPKGINPDEVYNRGLFYKNPTHLLEAERAINQSAIVSQITENHRRSRHHQRIIYDNEGGNPKGLLPGMTTIRAMDLETLEKFFQSVLRVRPNIFMIRISLGEYPNTQQIMDRRISTIATNVPRRHTDTAKLIAEAFADQRFNIVDFVYTIKSAEQGTYSSEAVAFTTDSDSYADDKYFLPVIEFDFIDA